MVCLSQRQTQGQGPTRTFLSHCWLFASQSDWSVHQPSSCINKPLASRSTVSTVTPTPEESYLEDHHCFRKCACWALKGAGGGGRGPTLPGLVHEVRLQWDEARLDHVSIPCVGCTGEWKHRGQRLREWSGPRIGQIPISPKVLSPGPSNTYLVRISLIPIFERKRVQLQMSKWRLWVCENGLFH